MNQFNQQFIIAVLDRYGLEYGDYHADHIVATWLQQYDRAWIVKAIIESIHRGRYKVKSVDSILSGWQRMGQPCYKFTPEFEREILQNLPVIVDLAEDTVAIAPPIVAVEPEIDDHPLMFQLTTLSCDQLNPEESAPFVHYGRVVLLAQPHQQIEPAPIAATLAQTATAAVLPQQPESNQVTENINITRSLAAGGTFQLFRTLRAIIEPSNIQSADVAGLKCDPG